MEKLDVIASFDWMDKEEKVGSLGYEYLRGSDVFSFEFDKTWLKRYPKIDFGCDLRPYTGVQYSQGNHIFGCFSDTLPNRWGRRLIDLRASLETEGKASHTLSDWDYLKGVEDEMRMGGFRFQDPIDGSFISSTPSYSVPPAIHIDELLQAAKEIEKSEYKHLEPEKKWVQRLFQPGSSMGGARPKACVQSGGQLYLAKFPSINDDINVSQWEHFAHLMAKECGITVAETQVIKAGTGQDILLSKRFDRTEDNKRIHMASSLTVLGLTDGDGQRNGKGYLDIVDFIISGGGNHIEANLEELYKRVAFNICIGNTDDHFRNHAFLLGKDGWELSPVYDMNPTNSMFQALLIDANTNESSLNHLYNAHELYMLDETTARGIIMDVTRSMKYWESMAEDIGLPRREITYFTDRFEQGMEFQYGVGFRR
ncbi:type II toxin-antitoxin system HipA family toxin [Prevotella bivia]|uniref:type II toxin-antitoxin system HipA family toxin n=1 Tax=Prevotella bivia TaxID=28125 RepID=UPI002550B47F|nr:HipA domain-containing protein [Prevotella bivia]MDZ3818581.1 HipA domain-containing protein [Prevotella bivia]